MTKWSDLFTPRQLVALSTSAELVGAASARIRRDALAAGMADDGRFLESGGLGATAYADAVATYLGIAVGKTADYNATLVSWSNSRDQAAHVFTKQALPMVWDFAEVNVFAEAAGDFSVSLAGITRALKTFGSKCGCGTVRQAEAQHQTLSRAKIVSTDPPYYDNVGYADLSDFFYVWLRRALGGIHPVLFATIQTPKENELVATPERHGGRTKAEAFFLHGMTLAMQRIGDQAHPAFPVSIYYAFKQAESDEESGTASTGWETFLEAVIRSGMCVTGTWPVRTERAARSRSLGSNALASSVVLVCRQRRPDAVSCGRREFMRELNRVLPEALDEMTKGAEDERSPVAPVDLSQAILGPGMAVFSRYSAVLEADGSPMTVRTALQLINRFLAEDDFDHDTQFCLHWFAQNGWGEGLYGEADVLARAKATSVGGLAEAGVVRSGGGKVRLLKPNEYPSDWDPKMDSRIPVWEALHQLIRALREQGESSAGHLLGAVKAKGEAIRQLAYRLYTLCERQGWADDARAYNELVTSWSAVESAAGEVPEPSEQLRLFGGDS